MKSSRRQREGILAGEYRGTFLHVKLDLDPTWDRKLNTTAAKILLTIRERLKTDRKQRKQNGKS